MDVGTQETKFGLKRQVYVFSEIPSLRHETKDGEDKPKVKNKKYNLSLHDKSTLGKDLASWRGKPFTAEQKKGFDITNLLGANCLLQIVHEVGSNEKLYDNIATITPLMKGMEKLSPENGTLEYSIADDGFDFPENMYDWLQEMILESSEYKAGGSPNAVRQDEFDSDEETPPGDGDIPF